MKYMLKSLKECRVNHKWICRLYSQGYGIAEIVRMTGYNKNTVKSHVMAEGIYIPGHKSERKREEERLRRIEEENKEENTEINLKNRENRNSVPPALITEYKKELEKCQANIKDIVVVEEDRQTEAKINGEREEEGEEAEEEEEQEVIEAADSIKLHKGESASELAPNNDQRQIAEIDKVINYCLKLLKDKDRLKRSKTSIINQVFSTMIEKKRILQGLDPNSKDRNQYILNFIASRDFIEELKKMKALKDNNM